MHAIKQYFLLATAVLTALALGACSQGSDNNTVDGINLVKKDQLTVCTHLPYKPFEFTDDSGDTVGFDVDLVDLLAKDLDVKLDVISMSWNQIVSGAAFSAGKCDVAMGGASITDKRKESVKFSDPYFNATQALLVKKDSDIDSLEDMADHKLGAQTATTGFLYAKKHADEFHYQTVEFDDLALMLTGVSSGKVAGAIGDNGPLAYYAAHNGDTRVADSFDTGEKYAFMVAKDDDNADKLVERLNDVLAKAREDGTYDKLYKKWFGKAPDNQDSE